MKSKSLTSYMALIIFSMVLFSCSKDKALEREHENATPETNISLNRTGLNEFRAWKKDIEKETFLESIQAHVSEEELFNYQNKITNKVTYVIANNKGVFEEYIQYNASDGFSVLSSYELSNSNTATIIIEDADNVLKINGEILDGFEWVSDFEIAVDDRPTLCCNSCYIVHDLLDIHYLDCLCCLGQCGFSCGPFPIPYPTMVSWQSN